MTEGPHDDVVEPVDDGHETDPPAEAPTSDSSPPADDDRGSEELTAEEPSEDQLPPPPPPDPPEETTLPPVPPGNDRVDRRQELVRTNGRRVLAGVGSGIGDYLDISPWIPRLAFIFLTPFGFFGPLAYVAAWLLIRREDEPDSIAERLWDRLRTGQNWVGALLVFIAVLIVIASFDFLRPGLVFAIGLLILGVLLYRENIGAPPDRQPPSPSDNEPQRTREMTTASITEPRAEERPPRPPRAGRPPAAPRPVRPRRDPSPLGRWTVGVALLVIGAMAAFDLAGVTEPFPRHYAAALLAVTGGGLLVGAIAGRARWLIVPGLFLIPVVVGVSFVDIPIDGDFRITEVLEQPGTVAELQETYDFEAGSFTLDLTEIDFAGADSVSIDMGAGELVVILPNDLAANVDVQVGVGDIGGVIGSTDGIGLSRTVELDGDAGPLTLDIELGAGEVDVIRGGS